MSLAALAHAAPAAPAFNTEFYATAATIIPVLFLAVAVQGNTYDVLIRALGTSRGRMRDRRSPLPQRLVALVATEATFLLACAILIYGALNEGIAVYALYKQKAEEPAATLFAVIFLVAVSAAGPTLAFLRAATGTTQPEARRPSAGSGETDTP
jgi:hypothetical protein